MCGSIIPLKSKLYYDENFFNEFEILAPKFFILHLKVDLF